MPTADVAPPDLEEVLRGLGERGNQSCPAVNAVQGEVVPAEHRLGRLPHRIRLDGLDVISRELHTRSDIPPAPVFDTRAQMAASMAKIQIRAHIREG